MENNRAYKTISEVAQEIGLVNKKNKKPRTHTLRFWEKHFKQIKPHVFSGKRRYYDIKTINTLKKIQFLLKNRGLTIKGVKNYLDDRHSELDENNNKTINTEIIKTKLNKISVLLKEIKNNG